MIHLVENRDEKKGNNKNCRKHDRINSRMRIRLFLFLVVFKDCNFQDGYGTKVKPHPTFFLSI